LLTLIAKKSGFGCVAPVGLLKITILGTKWVSRKMGAYHTAKPIKLLRHLVITNFLTRFKRLVIYW